MCIGGRGAMMQSPSSLAIPAQSHGVTVALQSPSHSAKSPGTHIPSPGGLKELAAANLTPSILPRVQGVISTIPPIQATTRSFFSYSIKSLISASISALICQYLKEGPHLFSLVIKIALPLSSLTPFCPLLPCY